MLLAAVLLGVNLSTFVAAGEGGAAPVARVPLPGCGQGEHDSTGRALPFRYPLLGVQALGIHRTVSPLKPGMERVPPPACIAPDPYPTRPVSMRSRAGLNQILQTPQRLPSIRERSAASRSAGLSPDTSGASPVEEWVRHYASDLQASADVANAIAVDRSGNVYVAGISDATYTGGDYLLIKYSADGGVLWTARYESVPNSYNEPTALAIDSAGNVYVTGYSLVSESNSEYATVKYSANGVRQWAVISDNSPDSTDVATSLAVDSRGGVFVTGYSYRSGTDLDYVTLKYSSGGTLEWAARYDGPGHRLDAPTQVALDPAGNVCVSGFSTGVGTGFDIATVSYTDQGAERWSSRYDSPSHDDDAAVAMVVDASGGVVVGGSSYGPASGVDFITLKYSSGGSALWQQRYNGPAGGDDRASALGCDASGNVYVTGQSAGIGTQEDFETVKYDRDGTLQWTRRFNNERNGPDIPVSIAVGRSGNVFVTGISRLFSGSRAEFATTVYDSGGAVLASWLYDGTGFEDFFAAGIAVDSDDNAYVTGASNGSGFDFATVKYASGSFEGRLAHYSSGTGGDRLAAMAADAFGNVYVTGSNPRDLRTVKFDSAGAKQWVAIFDQLQSPTAAGLAIDGSRNVYVTGYGHGSSGSLDMVTIKYNPAGVEQWAALYDGPALGDDRAVGIAIDGQQDVYVAGSSFSLATGNDYVTIKYSTGGIREWVARYNSPANLNDVPAALAVDSRGNVCVTGSSIRVSSSNDYATIKYAPDGTRQWLAYYNGPPNGSDFATAIALDTEGAVYVTGQSLGATSSADYATIKYSRLGEQEWLSRYTGPDNGAGAATAIAVDSRKNVFVTGYTYNSGTSLDYATLGYDSTGLLRWKAFHNGPADGVDRPVGMVLDRRGNVYVTGSSLGPGTGLDFATVAYNADGAQQWVVRYNGPLNIDDEAEAIAIDSAGSIYAAGTSFAGSSESYVVVRYTNGFPEWPSRYDGPGVSIDVVNDMAVDPAGNVYLTGGGYSANGLMKMLTVKYDASGLFLWSSRYQGVGPSYQEGRKVAVDREGNVCVIGLDYNLQSATDYLTVKYAADGTQQWAARYNRLGTGYNFPKAIAVDGDLNVYVTGTTFNGRSYDYTTVKYDSAGTAQWEPKGISYDGPSGGDDLAAAMVVGGTGTITVTGFSFGSGTSFDYSAVRYDGDGRQQWVARYSGPGNGDDRASAAALDSAGNVYVTGASVDTSHAFDEFATVAYDPDGGRRWAARYSSRPRTLNEAVAISADMHGSVYVTGNSYDSTYASSDFVTVKYDSTGTEQWVSRYDGPGHANDLARSNQLDGTGNIYVGGASVGRDGTYDYAVVKYNPEGHLEWVARHQGSGNSDDEAMAVRLDPAGNVYVSGTSSGYRWRVINTLKYSQSVSGVAEVPPGIPASFTLFQNYPNPFNPRTTIRYTLPKRMHVRVAVYDLLGRVVSTLADGVEDPGPKSVSFEAGNLSSGVYFYQVRSSDGLVASKKMMVLR